MRIFEKIVFSDGGWHDKGTVTEYKAIPDNGDPPKPNHNFEVWKEISFKEYKEKKDKVFEEFKKFII